MRRFSLVVTQIHAVGNLSLLIILASGMAVGFVLALQGYYTLQRYGSAEAVGLLVALGTVVGFLMWGIDDADGSCWLGGVLVDASQQGRGVGRAAVTEAVRRAAPDAALLSKPFRPEALHQAVRSALGRG